jgi:4-hydroxy-2-oxoheptanedioate aldolase
MTARIPGIDYVCIDMQHGAVDYTNVATMAQAILCVGNDGPSPIARVPWNEPGIIGKTLVS